MEKTRLLLKSLVGDSGMEKLEKAIFRRGTQNVADPLELYLPLLVVPRAILSWLAQNIKPLKIGEYKELKFPGQEDIHILVEKQNTDTYRGEFVQHGKVIHTFDKQTLPSIGGHFMTVGEVYDFEDKKDEKSDSKELELGKEVEKEHGMTIAQIIEDVEAGQVKPFEHYFQDIAEDHLGELKDYYTRLTAMEEDAKQDGGMVGAIMDMAGCSDEIHQQCHSGDKAAKYDAEKYKWFSAHSTTQEMIGLVGKLVDHLIGKEKVKCDISDELDKEEIKGDPQKIVKSPYPPKEVKDSKVKEGRYLTIKEVEKVAESIKSKQVVHDPEVGKVHTGKAEMPAGAAAPRQAMQPRQPAPASRQPAASANKQAQTAEKQAQASSQGKVVMAAKPKSASPAPASAVPATAKPPIPKVPSVGQSPKPPSQAGVNMKGEFSGRTSSTGYFRKQLNKCNTAKSESFIVTEEEIFSPCIHCGTAEFAKGEDNKPHFKPCACFAVEKTDAEGKARNWVEIQKNEKGFYELKFDQKADKDSVKAFLLTMKADLLFSRQKLGQDEK